MQDLYEEAIIENGEDDETPLDVPTDKRRVKTEKQDIPVETLLTRHQKGRLDLQPEFQ